MPPDEGAGAVRGGGLGGRRRPVARGRAATAASRPSTWAPRPGRAGGCCSPSTTTAGRRRTRPAGSGTSPTSSTPRSAGWTRCRPSGAPSTTPASRARSWPSWATRRWWRPDWAHAAGAAVHRRRPRRRARPARLRAVDARTSPRAARWSSTTCSPTPPTAAARRTSRSTCPALGQRPVRRGAGRRLAPRPRTPGVTRARAGAIGRGQALPDVTGQSRSVTERSASARLETDGQHLVVPGEQPAGRRRRPARASAASTTAEAV